MGAFQRRRQSRVERAVQRLCCDERPGCFPAHIVFEAHRQKKKLEIRYQEPDVNGTIPADLFTQQKPANVKEVPIEAIGS